MAMFGDLLVQLDPWQVEYGTELPFEDLAEAADDDVAAVDIELASDVWRAIRPDQATRLTQIIFYRRCTAGRGAVDHSAPRSVLPWRVREPCCRRGQGR